VKACQEGLDGLPARVGRAGLPAKERGSGRSSALAVAIPLLAVLVFSSVLIHEYERAA
jgi:hypothetical protein